MALLCCVVCGIEGAAPLPLISGELTAPVCAPGCGGLLLLARAAERDAGAGKPWNPEDRKQLARLFKFERLVTKVALFFRVRRRLAVDEAAKEWRP